MFDEEFLLAELVRSILLEDLFTPFPEDGDGFEISLRHFLKTHPSVEQIPEKEMRVLVGKAKVLALYFMVRSHNAIFDTPEIKAAAYESFFAGTSTGTGFVPPTWILYSVIEKQEQH